MENAERKTVLIRKETHCRLKALAAKSGRRINCEMADDVIRLGIEAFESTKKIFA